MPKKLTEATKLCRKILEKTGWKQYEFAQVIKAPPSTVNRWMKGVFEMRSSWRQAIEHHPDPKLQAALKEIRKEGLI